jgi:predicted dehydrogenase
VIARTSFCTPPAQTVWKSARAKGGGVLLDLATHHVDLLRYCLGQEVESVLAQIWSQQTEDDHALLQLKLSGEVAAQCFFSFGAVEEDRMEVYGSAGKLEVNRYLFDGVRRRSGSARALRREQLTDLMPTIKGARYLMDKKQEPFHEPSYRVALARFVGAARTGGQTTPDLFDGLRAQMVIEAAEESNRRGCTVVIPAVQGVHASEVEK